MAKLWRSLLGRDATRSDSYFTYQGIQYPMYGAGLSPQAKTEDVENDFIAYCQQIYKQSGVVYAVMAARRMLFRQARIMWQGFDDGVEGDLFWTPELEVFRKPWPGGTSGELLSRMDQDASLGGTAFVVREREGEKDRLRRLRPDWMTIVLTAPPAEAVKSDVAGFWFHPGRRYSAAGDPQPTDEFYLPGELCYWTPDPDPEAQYRGMSWLTPVIREVMADKAATSHKEKFFQNGATLGMIISAKENLTQKQFDIWKSTILEQHQGVDAAYKPLFLASPVDTSVQGLDLKQLDFKVTQGHGETRVCAAGRVPPIIVGVSEGLEAATYSNYGQARRAFGDGFAHSQWEDCVGALEELVNLPDRPARLWYSHQHIPFLREDQKDQADIDAVRASALRTLLDSGCEFETALQVAAPAWVGKLTHSGLFSVQLQPAGAGDQEGDVDHAEEMADAALVTAQMTAVAAGAKAGFDLGSLVDAVVAGDISLAEPGAPDTTPGEEFGSPSGAPELETERARDGHELHDYWTKGAGLGRWAGSPRPFTTLLAFLRRHMPEAKARKTTAEWFREVMGYLPKGFEDREEQPEAKPATDPVTLREQRERERRKQGRRRTTRRSVGGADRANELKEYWLRGEGSAKWSTWTELYEHLRHHVASERAKRIAAQWFHERYGRWPGSDANRVAHGKPPRGNVVGPG